MLLALLGNSFSATPDPPASGLEFFEKKVRPVLVDNCYKCHSSSSEKVKGGLLLDTREGLLKGGDTGPGLVPGDPEKSLLIKAVRYTDENLQMPPKNKKLSAEADRRFGDLGQDGRARSRSARSRIHALRKVPELSHSSLGLSAGASAGPSQGEGHGMGAIAGRFVHPGQAGGKRVEAITAGRSANAHPARHFRFDRFAADSRRSLRISWRQIARRFRQSGGSAAGFAALWRALGRHWLDVARYADTKGYVFRGGAALSLRLHLSRLRDPRLQRRSALRPVLIEQIAADQLDWPKTNDRWPPWDF